MCISLSKNKLKNTDNGVNLQKLFRFCKSFFDFFAYENIEAFSSP